MDWKSVQIDRLGVSRPTRRIIGLSDGAYPLLLREILDSPVVLYAQGDYSLILSRSNREEAFVVYSNVIVSVLRYVESTPGDGSPTALWIISSRTFFAEVSQC